MTIPLAPALLTGSSNLPGSSERAAQLASPHDERGGATASLFGLAPCEVLPATSVTRSAVRSYRTFSPLPFDSALRASLRARPPCSRTGHGLASSEGPKGRVERRYVFCATNPSGRPARELPGALPCGVRTFLSRGHFVRRHRRDGYLRQRSSGQLQHMILPLVFCRWRLGRRRRHAPLPDDVATRITRW